MRRRASPAARFVHQPSVNLGLTLAKLSLTRAALGLQ
jgi:hypothetical protein